MKNYFIYLLAILLQVNSIVLYAQDCAKGTANHTLITDDLRIRFAQTGSIWNYPYEVPVLPIDSTPISPIFGGGIWMGGYDSAQNLRLAGSYIELQDEETDYYPGPLDAMGTINPENCLFYDRFWSVSRAEIEAFQEDIADGLLSDSHPRILQWPAIGNPHFPFIYGIAPPNQDLAPFVDVNGDGQYNPFQGDYPKIKGDQAVWWIFNDAAGPHTESGGLPVGAEVQVLAYALETSDPDLKYISFYDFQITNKSGVQIDSFYTSLFMRIDLGCHTDDYTGCIPEEALVFAYNQDAIDGTIGCNCDFGTSTYCEDVPLFGIKQLEGFCNEQAQDLVPSAFVPFVDYIAFLPPFCPPYAPPENPEDYYAYMQGRLLCDNPLTYGDDGYQDGDTTTFAFPDNPADPEGWSMCTADLTGSRSNTTFSFGPIRFEYQDQIHLSFALIFVPNVPHPCPDITPLIEAGNKAQKLFDDISTSTKEEIQLEDQVNIFPNPMADFANLELLSGGDQLHTFQLFNSSGMLVRQEVQLSGRNYSIEKANLSAGIYFFQLRTQNGKRLSGRIIIQ